MRTAEKWLAAPSLRLADTAVSYRRVSARALAARRKEEARKFAARIKRRQGRQYARRKAQFKKQQIRLAGQRREMRLKKAMAKARQFAAARRHVALNMPRQPARSKPRNKSPGHRDGAADSVGTAAPLDSGAPQ
ncbi:MAG TPA: hypothetical protein VE986_05795 [Hyphomicrobiales bacterium]|nr:hypothetical protein [Hyphomicrobiales bacterium]